MQRMHFDGKLEGLHAYAFDGLQACECKAAEPSYLHGFEPL